MCVGNVSKRILMEFTIASNEIQHIVIRNSQLAGPRRSASRWINWHRKTTSIAHRLRSSKDLRKNWYITLNKSGRNAPMKLRSDFRETVTIMNRLYRESGEGRPEPILFINTKSGIRRLLPPVRHVGSGMSTGGAHFLEKKMLWQDRLQLMAFCCNRRSVGTEHPHTSHFLVFLCTHFNVARDIGSKFCPRHVIHLIMRLSGCLDSLRLSTLHSSQSLSSSTLSS